MKRALSTLCSTPVGHRVGLTSGSLMLTAILLATSGWGCSFTTDLDTDKVVALYCGDGAACPQGWTCGDNNYCSAPDAGPADIVVLDTSTAGDTLTPNDTATADTATPPDTSAPDTATPPDTSGCPAGQTRCGTLCVDTDTSGAHCGRCDNPCGGGVSCVAGACQDCPAPTIRCGVQCVNPNTNVGHCGGCDKACAAGTGACIAGTCYCERDSADVCYAAAPGTNSAVCDRRTCLLTCATGNADCDGDSGNGCEASSPCP